jgi:hypothetical protein
MLPRQFFFVYPPQHLRSGITFPIIRSNNFSLKFLDQQIYLINDINGLAEFTLAHPEYVNIDFAFFEIS